MSEVCEKIEDVKRKCPNCGSGRIEQNDNFCDMCGESLKKNPAESGNFPQDED